MQLKSQKQKPTKEKFIKAPAGEVRFLVKRQTFAQYA